MRALPLIATLCVACTLSHRPPEDITPTGSRAPTPAASDQPSTSQPERSPQLVPEGGEEGTKESAEESAEESARSEAPPAEDCGYTPPSYRGGPQEVSWGHLAGCGLAPKSADPLGEIADVETVSLKLGEKESLVEVVFLDSKGRRILPIGEQVRYEMRFRRKRRGALTLTESMHRDGVFRLNLPPNKRAAPCRTHLFIRIGSDEAEKESWFDDWLARC